MGFTDLSCAERDPKTGRAPRVPVDPNYRFCTSEPTAGHVYNPATGRSSGLPPVLDRRPFKWLTTPTPEPVSSAPPPEPAHSAPDRRKIAAFHESGHVVTARSCGARARFASVEPNANSDGRCDLQVLQMRGPNWRLAARYEIIKCLGGAAAVKNEFGEADAANSTNDLAEARAYATITCAGTRVDPDDFLNDCVLEAGRIVRSQWRAVQSLANALLDRGSLDETELRKVVRLDDNALQRHGLDGVTRILAAEFTR